MFLVKNGADPELKTQIGSAYEFSDNETLNKEMAEVRKKYLDNQIPKTSLKNPKLENSDQKTASNDKEL